MRFRERNKVKYHIEVGKRLLRSTSILIVAGVLMFSNVAPAVAARAGQHDEGAARDKNVATEIESVEQFLKQTDNKSLNHEKQQVVDKLSEALDRKGMHWDWWNDKHWKSCKAVEKLTHLLALIDRLRQKWPSNQLEELYTKIWTLRNAILMSLPEGERCGFDTIGKEPSTEIRASDNKQLTFDVDFGMPTLSTAVGNGQTFTRTHVPGIENMVGKIGDPAIPMWRELIALPEGATPVIKKAEVKRGAMLRMNLVPHQEQPIDVAPQFNAEGVAEDRETPTEPPMATFADKPFSYNEQSYKTDRTLPTDPCKITPMGQYRDVQIAQLECTTAQYNPVTDAYQLLTGIDIEVEFKGGAENFITSRTLSPFEGNASLTTDAVLNKAVLRNYSKYIDISQLQCYGEELLILTHANFRAAADELAVHKRNKGISTSVFNVGSGVASRDTAEEIDDFIEDRYDECKVRPAYVMLMGDAEFIPTFYPAGMAEEAGTDFPYSNYVQILFDAFFPDFGLGRIPVDTLDQANTVVDKIVEYESSPPHLGFGDGGPFYTNVGLAAQFQGFRMNANGTPLNNQPGTDQRAFIETTEFVRDELIDRGYTAPRIYTRTVDNGGYCIQENASGDCIQTQAPYNGDTTPRRYYNGNLLPAAIGGGSGFAWDGDTADVSAAWNAGRFLFLHRDHGWPNGWGDPGFSSSNVDALTNGDLLPVVFSVNCASGIFDNETAGGIYGTTNSGVYFAERALRKADGGAIGVIGDTRNSPTWANNALTRGFFDAVWTNTLPGEGSSTSHKRLGDILNWGKIYLASQVGIDQTAGSVSVESMGFEYNIWHVIGDPTLEMWTKNPHKLSLSTEFKVARTNLGEAIEYKTDGATITKLQQLPNGEMAAIGRATVRDGVADMQYFDTPNPQLPSFYSASLNDAVSVQLRTDVPDTSPR